MDLRSPFSRNRQAYTLLLRKHISHTIFLMGCPLVYRYGVGAEETYESYIHSNKRLARFFTFLPCISDFPKSGLFFLL